MSSTSSLSTSFIRLSPSGTLHFEHFENPNLPHSFRQIQQVFHKDWREGWFSLAANKASVNQDATIRFWQEIASHYLTQLCHLPQEMEFAPLNIPEMEQLTHWFLRAPPMVGGEYLSPGKIHTSMGKSQ